MSVRPRAVDALISSNRILVIGPSGSGKTYLARRLARLLESPVIHLDACFWRPGWVSTPQAEWRQRVDTLIRPARWIMDGTYESTLQLRIAAADAIIVIERSRPACLWGVLQRTITHRSAPRPDAPRGQPIDRAFLRYIWQYPVRTRPLVQRLLAEHGRHKAVVVLNGPGDIDTLLLQVRTRLQASTGVQGSGRSRSEHVG
jgi:adenylate kinase family enzyme